MSATYRQLLVLVALLVGVYGLHMWLMALVTPKPEKKVASRPALWRWITKGRPVPLCPKHASKLRAGQLALIDPNRCFECLRRKANKPCTKEKRK